MRLAFGTLVRPWTWPWYGWLALFLFGVAGWWGGRHVWAWHQFNAGVRALDRYHAAEAREHFSACLAIWPGHREALLLSSRAARRAGDFEAAERQIRACERLDQQRGEKRGDTVFEWSLLRAAAGDIDGELETFLAQVPIEPKLLSLKFEALVEGCVRVYRIKEASENVEDWLVLEPDNPQALYLRASIQRQIRKPQKAVPDFERVLDLDPTRDDARKFLALGLIEGGRYADALYHLQELPRRTVVDPEVTVAEARAHSFLGQADQARRLLDELLAAQPEHALALRVRGEVELHNDRPAAAEPWLRRALAAAPHEYKAHHAFMLSLERQGKTAEAKTANTEAERLRELSERLGEIMGSKMSVRPHDPALHAEMGSLFIKLGQPEQGVGWLQSALRKDPAFRPAHEALADHYEHSGDGARARYHRSQIGQ